jgi:hypothetical protein
VGGARGGFGRGKLAVDRLIQCHGERVLIAARVRAGPQALLGGHITRCAGDDDVGLVRAREAEVGDADAAVAADQHIVRFEVAVHHAGCVGRGEAAAGADEGGEDLVARRLRRALEPGAEGLTGDQLHRNVDTIVALDDIVDDDDVRVGQPREGLGLANEAGLVVRADLVGAPVLSQHLERDLAVEDMIVGDVDDAHTADAGELEDLEAPLNERVARQDAGAHAARCLGRGPGGLDLVGQEGREPVCELGDEIEATRTAVDVSVNTRLGCGGEAALEEEGNLVLGDAPAVRGYH